jgi:protein-disulfide isomerase
MRLGSPNAKVTLIEYADIQCPACRQYTETLFPTVVDEYVRTGKVKAEFRGYPFLGDDSLKGERFLLAAAEQNKMWQLMDAFYRNQGAEHSGWLTDDLIRKLASQIPGLDVDTLFARAQSDELGQAAQQSAAAAQSAGIQGTPTLLVQIGNGTPYEIQVATPDQIRQALDDALTG